MDYGALEDSFAKQDIESLITRFGIKRVVETGSYYGWSTKVFASLVESVDSIEIEPNYIEEAKKHLEGITNVNLHLGDSVTVMNEIVSENEKNILFFLDAHWQEHWPILNELEVIKNKKLKPVICIHDFFVPGGTKLRQKNGRIVSKHYFDGSKFGYDEFNSVALDFKYIENSLKEIYGEDFNYHYNTNTDKVDSGLIYIYPSNND
jgi:predicted O-methyltransferase YrrM